MNLEKKFLIKYLDTIIELSKETGMSKNESRTILDVALANQNPKSVDFLSLIHISEPTRPY